MKNLVKNVSSIFISFNCVTFLLLLSDLSVFEGELFRKSCFGSLHFEYHQPNAVQNLLKE